MSKDKFVTVEATTQSEFDRLLNYHLKLGYVLHGPPSFISVAHSSVYCPWDNAPEIVATRNWTENKYRQCLILLK